MYVPGPGCPIPEKLPKIPGRFSEDSRKIPERFPKDSRMILGRFQP